MAPPPAFLERFSASHPTLVGVIDVADALGLNIYLGYQEADLYFVRVAHALERLTSNTTSAVWRPSGDKWVVAGDFAPHAMQRLAETVSLTRELQHPWKRSVIAQGLVRRDSGTQPIRVTCAVRAMLAHVAASPDTAADTCLGLLYRAKFAPVGLAVDLATVPTGPRTRWSSFTPIEPIPFTCPFCMTAHLTSPAEHPTRCTACDARVVFSPD